MTCRTWSWPGETSWPEPAWHDRCEKLRRRRTRSPRTCGAFCEHSRCPRSGWAVVAEDGQIHAHPTRRAEPEEWAWVLAHGLLHLGFGHFQRKKRPREWAAACCCTVWRFLADLKFGRPPEEVSLHGLPSGEENLYEHFCEAGITAGPPARPRRGGHGRAVHPSRGGKS